MAAIMELKTKMINIETKTIKIKGDIADLLHRNSVNALPSYSSRPSPYYMPQFSYPESPYDYAPPPDPLNSSFSTDPSLSSSMTIEEQPPLSDNLITQYMINEAKLRSSSRSNFATNLVRQLFDEDTRAKSNISGLCKKDKLDPKKIDAVKKTTFQVFPMTYGENSLVAWKKCHVAIDESCRRLNKKK